MSNKYLNKNFLSIISLFLTLIIVCFIVIVFRIENSKEIENDQKKIRSEYQLDFREEQFTIENGTIIMDVPKDWSQSGNFYFYHVDYSVSKTSSMQIWIYAESENHSDDISEFSTRYTTDEKNIYWKEEREFVNIDVPVEVDNKSYLPESYTLFTIRTYTIFKKTGIIMETICKGDERDESNLIKLCDQSANSARIQTL